MMPKPPNGTHCGEQIARDLGFRLFSHYGEREAAGYLDIHPVTLKKLRLAGSIGYVAKGQRAIAYFGLSRLQFAQRCQAWPSSAPPPQILRPISRSSRCRSC